MFPGPGTFPEADRMPRMNVWRVLIVQRNPVDSVGLFFHTYVKTQHKINRRSYVGFPDSERANSQQSSLLVLLFIVVFYFIGSFL